MAPDEIEAQIPDGLGLFITEPASLDKNFMRIKEANGELALPQQVAQARIVAPKEHSVWQQGSRVAASIIYIPNEDFVLWTLGLKYSPIFENLMAAVKAHNDHSEVNHAKEVLDVLLAEAKSGKNVLLDKRIKNFKIPSSELHKDAFGRFYFGNDAEAYGQKLIKIGLENISVILVNRDYVQKQEKPFSRVLRLHSARIRSGLDGDDRVDGSLRARGVLKLSA